MASYQIVYWRNIPAQVKAREGRERASRQLSDRFQVAIDRAAMRAGLFNTDDYLSEWRTSEALKLEGAPDAVADALLAELESAYSDSRLEALVASGGLE